MAFRACSHRSSLFPIRLSRPVKIKSLLHGCNITVCAGVGQGDKRLLKNPGGLGEPACLGICHRQRVEDNGFGTPGQLVGVFSEGDCLPCVSEVGIFVGSQHTGGPGERPNMVRVDTQSIAKVDERLSTLFLLDASFAHQVSRPWIVGREARSLSIMLQALFEAAHAGQGGAEV